MRQLAEHVVLILCHQAFMIHTAHQTVHVIVDVGLGTLIAAAYEAAEVFSCQLLWRNCGAVTGFR